MGALDVCPFIPIRGVTVEECVTVSRKFASLLASALDIPVFLYGSASGASYRATMPQIRAGEYEGLEEKASIFSQCKIDCFYFFIGLS